MHELSTDKQFDITLSDGNITFNNFNEIRDDLNNMLATIETDVDYKQAKDTRVKLNKMSNALNDKRKEIKNAIMSSYDNEFNPKVKELDDIILAKHTYFDNLVKEADLEESTEKNRNIEKEVTKLLHKYIEREPMIENLELREHLFDTKWLNKTYKMSDIRKDVNVKLGQIVIDLTAIKKFPNSDELFLAYSDSFDIATAIISCSNKPPVEEPKKVSPQPRTNNGLPNLFRIGGELSAVQQWVATGRRNGLHIELVD